MTTALQLQAGPLQWARGHCRRTARASDLAAASNFNLVFITLLFHHYLLETRNFELSKIFSLSANIFQLHLSNYIAGGAESANRAALCRGQTTDLLFIMAQNLTTLKKHRKMRNLGEYLITLPNDSPLQTVAELGVVIFTALDYGLKDEEERQLSPALENVIDLMTSAGRY